MKDRFQPLNFGLGETIDLLREQVNAFANEHIAPLAADIDRANHFPEHLWTKLGAMGLHGVTVSEEYGGAEMGYLAHVVAMEEISRAPLQLHSATVPTPTCALTKSTVTATRSKKPNTFPH